ncbi:MAG: GNAT family N-acetyltransferase [Bacteroidota bacterium]
MILQTARTHLQLAQASDFNELLAMYAEPDTFKYIKPLQNRSRQEYFSFLQSRIDLSKKEEGYYWVARLQDSNELVGAMNLTPFRDTGIMQIGFQLRRKFWQQGFGTELAEAVLQHAVTSVGLTEVYGFYESENIASHRILQKLGFRFKERRQFDADDVPLEVVVFEGKK